MKVLAVLALIAVVSGRPTDILRSLNIRKPDGPHVGGPVTPGKPEEKPRPLSKDDVLELLDEAEKFSGGVQNRFQSILDAADSLSDNEEDLKTLGDHVGNVIQALVEVDKERAEDLGDMWVQGMTRLVYAGVEDEGQCHKLLEFLKEAAKEAEKDGSSKRQMSPEELEMWQEVARAAKEEVQCIVDRFQEFVDMVQSVSNAIRNPPADYNEDGHAFEAEILMGSLLFGYNHLYRQVVTFIIVVDAIASEAENAGSEPRKLNELLREAQSIKRRMDEMKSFKRQFRN